MEIIILGTGCSRCKALEAAVRRVVDATGIDATVRKEEDMARIMEYNVMALPALVVDGNVVSKGKVLNEAEVQTLLGL
ncbi:thioredoxin family protein [Prevotella sp.]|uniref:thioredoxin family protein n=1 Tax=Prevotella sp. TaxID=59823 RepID=UPI002F9567B1